ncbi:MAG: twin-arginine translocase TatA/TatE family subunit [Chloroflexi bacterium]|nr:twin-arginine translocase TatA/TatE family subunit [Chloroflexota bacterium]
MAVEYHPGMTDTAVVLLIILVLAVIWRGPRTLPEIGRLLGRAVKGARAEVRAMRKDEDDPADTVDR